MDILSDNDKMFNDVAMRFYNQHLATLDDEALRAETVAAVTEANALRMEACRNQWESIGRSSEFLWCYNIAVKEMK